MELDALPDLERPDRGVRVRLPARCERRYDLPLRRGERQELAGDAGERERAAFVQEVRLERGTERRDAEPNRAALLDGRRGARRGRCCSCLARKREHAAHHADRKPEHRAAAQELAAVHLAADELVDQIVLERPRLVAAKVLDPPCRFTIHRLSLTFRFDIDLDGHVDACTEPKLEVLLVTPTTPVFRW